jgi:hypothetical protein
MRIAPTKRASVITAKLTHHRSPVRICGIYTLVDHRHSQGNASYAHLLRNRSEALSGADQELILLLCSFCHP